jgi:HK97 gp10 family phage protein
MAKKPIKVATKSSKAMKLEGVPELLKTVNAIAKTMSGEGAAAFVERAKLCTMRPALVIRDEAIDMAPEGETGNLKASLFAAPLHKHVGSVVGTHGVYYAPFVEFGTSRNSANPFLRPAINASRPTFAAMMADDLRALIADVAAANAAHPPVTK